MKLSNSDFLQELSDEEQSKIVGGYSTLSTNAISAANDIASSTSMSNEAYMRLLDRSTAQTLQIQTALLNHNLRVGPIMTAKSASEDAKKV
jgi:HPt (histidine-containing phosphotransfer) domain-containing protein